MTTKRMIFTTDSGASDSDPYFDWLCRKVGMGSEKRYFELGAALHAMAFRPGSRIETDKNRAQDGMELRVEFMNRYGRHGSALNRGPCSMLEFLVGLARKMSFIMCEDGSGTDDKTGYYFWKLIRNLRLLKLDDERYEALNGDFFVQEAVDRVLLRTYDEDGDGGLFPLRRPCGDQRNVEIWYQMQYWLGENFNIEEA